MDKKISLIKPYYAIMSANLAAREKLKEINSKY